MDFGLYPPEINSGRMYAGPGSGPLLAAAQAWEELADELYTAATSYRSAVSELTSGSWSGPSSVSMTAAASAYVEWLSATAAQAERTAAQGRAAAAAYETAFALTVPPPVIAANRSMLAALVATNFLGQNTPAIAATEAHYAEMWGQDAVTMYTYAGSSAAATALPPFSSPDENTDPAGTASQAAAVSQAVSTPAGDAQSIASSVPQAFSAVPNALQSLATAAPAASSSTVTPLDLLADLINVFLTTPTQLSLFGVVIPLTILGGPVDLPFAIGANQVSFHEDDIVSAWNGDEVWPSTGSVPVAEFPAILTNPGPTVSAGVGEANTVGRLSVPSSWTVAAPEIRSVAMVSPMNTAGITASAPLEAGSANTVNQMGIAGMAGQAMAGPPAPAAAAENGKTVTGARLMARGPGTDAATQSEAVPAPRTVMTGVAAAIRDIAKLRDEGRLTEQEYNERKRRLLQISFGQ